MATDHNFRIKNGLEVGGQLIVTSSGALVVSSVQSNLSFNDNIKAKFGNGSDLQIYHDGSNSWISDAGTGSLIINGDNVYLRSYGGESKADFITNGAVTLYYDNAAKIATTSTGIDVTGRIDLDDSNTQLSSGSGNSLRINTNGGQTEIGPQNTSWSHFTTDRPRFYFSKGITVETGLIGSYDEDLQIQRAGTTKLTVTTTGVDIVGDLSITGDLNTVNTTTLDVSDKVITAGVGGTTSTNDGGGFKISGANAEFIWDNTNAQMTLNKDFKFTADQKLRFGNTYFYKSGNSNNVHFYATEGFIPHSTTVSNNATLGNTVHRWNGVYSSTGDFSGTITINQGDSFSKLDIKTSRTGAASNIGGVQFYNSSNAQKSQLYGTNDGQLKLATNGTTVALTLDASQNATFAGTISSGSITSTGAIGNIGSQVGQQLELGNTTTATLRFDSDEWRLYSGGTGSSGEVFTISQTGDAVFSGNGNLTALGTLQAYSTLYTRSNLQVLNAASNGWNTWASRSNGNYNLTVGTISSGNISSGTITSSGNIDVNSDSGQLQFGADNDMQIFHNGAGGEINNATGNFTIDSSGDIDLDADGGDIKLRDAGVLFGSLSNSSSNLVIKSGSTTVLDSSRNLTNIGTISSGAITATNISVGNSAGNTRGVIDTNATYYAYYNTETSPRIQLGRDVGISGGAGLALGGNSSYALIGTNNTSGSAMYFKTASAVATVTTNPDMTLNSSGNLTVRGTVTATGGNSTNWNTAYGWGNHASAGYTSNVGDITGVTAGTGLTGGGTSGTPTLNVANTISPATALELSSSQDLDDLVAADAGFYYQTANADTTNNNYPTGEAGSLIVQKSAGTATQMYQTYSTVPRSFFRSRYTAGWSTWREHWHTGNLTSATIATWNTAYGWGNHASAGYLTSHQSLSGYLLNTTDTFAGNLTFIGGNNSSKESFINVKRGNASGLWLKFQTDGTSANNVSQFVIRRSTDNVDILNLTATNGNIAFVGTVTASGGNSTNWNTAYGWGNYASAPNAPSITSTTVVNETIEIVFGASTSTGNTAATSYEVWSDGGTGTDYSLIAKIPYNDIASSMSVVDSSFDDSGTIAYRVYAIRHGAYSTAATTTRAFTMPSLDVSGMSVIADTNNYYIQYELPTTRFIDHIEIYKDVETTSAALARSGASLVYSGNNTSYKYNIGNSDMEKYHQFWVEVVTV
jgi:hypothetical protein